PPSELHRVDCLAESPLAVHRPALPLGAPKDEPLLLEPRGEGRGLGRTRGGKGGASGGRTERAGSQRRRAGWLRGADRLQREVASRLGCAQPGSGGRRRELDRASVAPAQARAAPDFARSRCFKPHAAPPSDPPSSLAKPECS